MPRARTDWRAARAGDYLITNNMSDHARICLSDMITLCGGRAALLLMLWLSAGSLLQSCMLAFSA